MATHKIPKSDTLDLAVDHRQEVRALAFQLRGLSNGGRVVSTEGPGCALASRWERLCFLLLFLLFLLWPALGDDSLGLRGVR